jgi:hypothetical protein
MQILFAHNAEKEFAFPLRHFGASQILSHRSAPK